MTEKIICEKCGSEMIDKSAPGSICVECPKCGWGWATTTYDPADDDTTEYEIWLMPGNLQTKAALRTISETANINYLEAKKLLESETPALLYKAHHEAVAAMNNIQRIQTVAKKLSAANIRFSIVPDFPYNLE